MKRFLAFCVKFKVLSPFPVSEYLLCGFAAFLADQGLAPQTAKCYLAAVRNSGSTDDVGSYLAKLKRDLCIGLDGYPKYVML